MTDAYYNCLSASRCGRKVVNRELGSCQRDSMASQITSLKAGGRMPKYKIQINPSTLVRVAQRWVSRTETGKEGQAVPNWESLGEFYAGATG